MKDDKWARALRAMAHEISRGRIVPPSDMTYLVLGLEAYGDNPRMLRVTANWDQISGDIPVASIREDGTDAN